MTQHIVCTHRRHIMYVYTTLYTLLYNFHQNIKKVNKVLKSPIPTYK